MEISPITHEDIPALSRLYADAFVDNAGYTVLFPSTDMKSSLQWLFERRIRIWIDMDMIGRKAEEKGQLLGACFACHDGKTPLWQQIKNGILMWPIYFGIESFKRVLEMDNVMPHLPGTWELSMMAVDPAHQGKGIGTKVLKAIIEAVHVREPNAILSLNTQKPINVTFYSKQGFKLISDKPLHGNRVPEFPNWQMKTE